MASRIHSDTAALPVQNNVALEKFSSDLLRVITCGSVDDGKSTLIGRLLWETQHIAEDQVQSLQSESQKYGTQGNAMDFALLVDGLSAEREQGITIDVAYRYFSTKNRKFILVDTPGHEQYTRNMVTGASNADIAVLLINAQQGIMPQTHRHAFLVHLMGIRHVILAVNKMDLVRFSETSFNKIINDFTKFVSDLHFLSIKAIPVSALKGDNLTNLSLNTPWFTGPSLMTYLETVPIQQIIRTPFIFPVQWVNHPDANFRGFSGTITSGKIQVGDEIRVSSSGQLANVKEIVGMDANIKSAELGDAVTLVLDKNIDVSRGDVLSLSQQPLEITEQFAATLVWMDAEEGMIGRSYDLKLATQWASASITAIKHQIDTSTLEQKACRSLKLNEIALCHFALSKPVVFDDYSQCKSLGGFILVDKFSHNTVAAGIIHYSLYRAQNIHKQALSIGKEHRERLNGHNGKVIWFTGLSGAGKSVLANALEIELHQQGKRTYILDGDNIRHGLNKDLGFTDADRVENIRRVAEVAKLMMDAGLIVMTAMISPFRHERQMVRDLIGEENFMEVYVNTPLAVCEQRDPKGLYKKARTGNLPNMTGINSPYEIPRKPDFTADGMTMTISQMVFALLTLLENQSVQNSGKIYKAQTRDD